MFHLNPLQVIVGANGSGKSSLIEFLKFIWDACYQEIPPEIIAGAIGQQIFHIGLGAITDSTLSTLFNLREFIRGWRFYNSFHIDNLIDGICPADIDQNSGGNVVVVHGDSWGGAIRVYHGMIAYRLEK